MNKAPSPRWNRQPPAGFRFSLADLAAIAVCALATWAMWPLLDTMAAAFPIVLGHFFLFCNIFRVPRLLELLWGAVFLINFAARLSLGRFAWSAVLWTQLPFTLVVILTAIFQKDYHGIGYKLVSWGRRPESTFGFESKARR
jgi:hypothetical protein